jgi:hypothetical protein
MLSRAGLQTALRASTRRGPALSAAQLRYYAQASEQDTKPPVAVYGVDGTYASALVSNHSANSIILGFRLLLWHLNEQS